MFEGTMEAGVQPLDAWMDERGVRNHDLVDASTEQLTHKEVGKARRGRRLTRRLQEKVLQALQAACPEASSLTLDDCFTYRGR